MAPTPGADFELFGGAVSGKVKEVDPPTKLVESWNTKSPGWPADHYGTMTITLKQGSDSTNGKLNGSPKLANSQLRSSSTVSRPARRTTLSVPLTSSTSRGE